MRLAAAGAMAAARAVSALPVHDRPRERLLDHGPSVLSDTELVALLFGSGLPGRSVLDVAASLLGRMGGLAELTAASTVELEREPGVGPARAALLHAAFELGRRVAGRRPERGQKLGHAADVWTHFRARLGHLAIEEFWMVGLDVRHRIQLEACVARGSLTGVEVHPRDVFRPLIRAATAAVIFCHNHPSGDPAPSRQDIELTARLRDVGRLCDITVLDHVIVAADGFTSLAGRGWI